MTATDTHLFQCNFNAALVFHDVATIIVDELRQCGKCMAVADSVLAVLYSATQKLAPFYYAPFITLGPVVPRAG